MDSTQSITEYIVCKINCTPAEMYDEKIFFEDLQELGCWYRGIKDDPEQRFYLFINKAEADIKINNALDCASKQKVSPLIESIGSAVKICREEKYPGGLLTNLRISISVEIDGQKFNL